MWQWLSDSPSFLGVSEMVASDAVAIARKNLFAAVESGKSFMESSARLCLSDAVSAMDRGDDAAAIARAGRSLAYSVGIAHRDYQRVTGKSTL
jgi:hypothetical protein